MKTTMTSVLVYVNGTRRTIPGEDALQPLLTYLRLTERLTGAKLGCGEGGCGACTVLLSAYRGGRIVHRAVNACLLPVASVDGCAVTTVEGVGDRRGGLAPVQEVLARAHGSQCGFCTPGIVMSMFALLRERTACGAIGVREDEVEACFDGNLCRCTGYRPILDAFKGLVRGQTCGGSDGDGVCASGTACCKANVIGAQGNSDADYEPVTTLIDREYLFPPELIRRKPPELNLCNGRWLRPTSLDEFLACKSKHPDCRIVVGNTELGIEARFKGAKFPVLLCATHIPEMTVLRETKDGAEIGAAVTWEELDTFIRSAVEARRINTTKDRGQTLHQTSTLTAVQSQLRWFAGKQIRNVAAVGGNIVTASPISDLNPVWIAADAVFVVLDAVTRASRTVPARAFFVSYRKVDMSPTEVLLKIVVPWNISAYDVTHAFKVSRRKEDDIAIVSAGIRIRLEPHSDAHTGDGASRNGNVWRIAAAAIGFGGLAPTTVAASSVEALLLDKPFCNATLQMGLDAVCDAFVLPKNVPGGMPEFRRSLAMGFLFKAFIQTAVKVDEKLALASSGMRLPSALASLDLGTEYDHHSDASEHRSVSRGSQIFAAGIQGKEAISHIGKPLQHASANLQVSGEAVYLDDTPAFQGELHGALVLSSEPHAVIVSVDAEVALAIPGVRKVVSFPDVVGNNNIGPNVLDEQCFATGKVTSVGQAIAIVVADTQDQAKEGARAVRVKYNVLPAIVTIEDAIAAESFAPNVNEHSIETGDVQSAFAAATTEPGSKIVSGCVRIGAQEHWYLEPQGTIAVPQENDEMMVLASTQAASKTQEMVARVLGVPMHKVVCRVKRVGGGFGGKETRSIFISAAAAVAAQAVNRPVRLILDRDVDMLITGTRHAFYAEYKAACTSSGRITALRLRIYNNMGNTTDLSIPVLDRSLFHAQNCYDIPNVSFIGRACFTNSPSATAFRGFGGPQGMLVAENVIEHVASITGLAPKAVRSLNLYGKNGNGAVTSFGMRFNVSPLLACWDGVLDDSAFDERRKAIALYNEKHRDRKRGLSAIPTMFGISFTFRTYNQAGALVHIYHGDGSVLISHGGVEMGQGLHTKMMQVAATALGVPMSKVFISDTATDKVPNASPSAASSSSDLYGMAVKNACEKLNDTLGPVRAQLSEKATWEEVIQKAWFDRKDLSAHGFYRTPELDQLDLGTRGARGQPFLYYTNGAAVSEVEIDILTGEHSVLRTDIVMDVGRPLNPAIDIGQIEGAFVQGLGWCTMEEIVRGSSSAHVWIKPGQMFTLGPSTYKIPGFGDIPADFRVRMLNIRNEKDTIHSSKAVGEPPLFLAASVFFAIRDAIRSARAAEGLTEWFTLDSPATVERIRMACPDAVLRRVVPDICDADVTYRPALTL